MKHSISYQVEAEGLSDVGRKRELNEDAILLDPQRQLFLLADGVGGHAAGEVASELAVKTIKDFLDRFNADEDTWPVEIDPARSDSANVLTAGVQLANRAIFHQGQEQASQTGMATTLVALYIVNDAAVIAHVGDSRLYRIRDNMIHPLTEDHTVVNELRYPNHHRRPSGTFPEAEKDGLSRFKHVLSRALGRIETVMIDSREEPLQDHDLFLLCSDGLSNLVRDDQVLTLIQRHGKNLKNSCQALVDKANRNGGKDNISCILVRCTLRSEEHGLP